MCVTEIYNVKEKVMLDLQDLNKLKSCSALRKNAFDLYTYIHFYIRSKYFELRYVLWNI